MILQRLCPHSPAQRGGFENFMKNCREDAVDATLKVMELNGDVYNQINSTDEASQNTGTNRR